MALRRGPEAPEKTDWSGVQQGLTGLAGRIDRSDASQPPPEPPRRGPFWTRVLARAASLLASRPRLGWYPGWRFGIAEEAPSLGVRVRRAVWKLWEEGTLAGPIPLPWHDGLRLEMPLGTDLSRCLYVSGSYDPNEFMFLSSALRPGMVCIDVGANEGLYTLFASRRVGPTGLVLALEPSSREYERLIRNLWLNQASNVVAVKAAASERSGCAELHIAEPGHGGHNTLGRFAYPVRAVAKEKVELLSLDQLYMCCPLPRVDFIKIDAEGSELSVIRGAHGLLERFRPLLQVEILDAALEGQGADRRDLLESLRSHGYQFWILGPTGEPRPIEWIEQDGINFLASHPEGPVRISPRGTAHVSGVFA
jgi:FkbM family methyltransferase